MSQALALPLARARRKPLNPAKVLRIAAIVLLAALYLTPLVVVLLSSIKSPAELADALTLPAGIHTRNYVRAWERIGPALWNSVLITAPSVVLSVLVGAIAAFPLSQIRFVGGRVIYFLLLAGMLIPHQIVQIPLFLIMRGLGLYNTIPGMWLVHVAYGIPFCTFFMRNFFTTIPRSMFEAAQIDGCGPAGYFFKILMPASLSGLATLAIIQSRSVWNDLFFALTLTSSPDTQPVPMALYSFLGGMEVDEGPIMAATVLSMLPMLIVFLAFQKAFTRGLLGGSGK
ncbi:carbohydrate ABC transporter permease [Roseomonas sp. OT10]|uniref:carbohydrate ABC transporter permease n=1 Tax=Roseomonas cutis TaxID=2897332 RepID=UPI001E4A4219|nr:carbohydrate ABC transporter permease [Roseomonas sp. OT10]UFN48224.1 carbohydrate ABC transporter permease [Roseomonas sp. OT10]